MLAWKGAYIYAVVFYTAGPEWKKGRPAREQELEAHKAYQLSLASKDPAVTSKVMRALVQHWEPSFGEVT
jgi:hypothetical protein